MSCLLAYAKKIAKYILENGTNNANKIDTKSSSLCGNNRLHKH